MRSKPSKVILVALGFLIGLVILVGAVSALYLTYHGKPQVESYASDALGVEVAVGGIVHIGLFPSPHLGLADVHLRNQGAEFATVSTVELGLELLPVLRHEVRIDRIVFKQLTLSLERDHDGKLNLPGPEQNNNGPLPDVTIGKVSASKAVLLYKDDRTGNGFEAEDCTADLSHLRLLGGERDDWVKRLSFEGKAACARFKLLDLVASDVRLAVEGSDGVLDFNPVTLTLFDGRATADVRADFSRAEPLYQVRYQLAAFRIEEFFKTLSPQPIGRGAMDFSSNLSLRGTTIDRLTRTAAGSVSLRGSNLTLEMGDLDKKFERFESTQNFNLVDVGAFFFAGPIGLGISKGYDYARMLRPAEGTTTVRTLVSEWRIEQGVAHGTDVAMATNKKRVALQGDLDFVTQQFDDVTVALVDANGCPEAVQKVRGLFLKPEVAEPSILKTLAGPTRRLLGKATGLLGHKCAVFYAGSVEAPQ